MGPFAALTKTSWGVPSNVLALLSVGGLYLASGVLALELYPVGKGLTGIWPAAGIAVAAALILGPLATASVFFGDFLFGLYAGLPPVPALTLALGSLAEALIAWWLLVRLMPIDHRLQRTRDVAIFIALGALPSALLCVVLRVGLMAFLGNEHLLDAEFVGWLLIGFVGHSLGILVVAPFFLTWNAEPHLPRRQVEFGALLLATAVLNIIGFSVTVAAPGSAILYPIFVAVLWAALRFGPRETALVIAMTGVFATWAAGSGSGPFLLSNQNEALISLSLFLFVATATALFLGAAANERDLYLQRVVDSEHTQRALIDQMAEGVVTLDLGGRLQFASERFCSLCGMPREELIGLRLGDLFQEAPPSWVDTLPGGFDARLDAEIEASLMVPGQGKHSLAITMRRMTDAGGRSLGTMAVVADITARRKAEEQSQQHLRQLAHIGRVKSLDEMAVAFAHEVAQPLTATTTYIQAAQRFLQSGELRRSSLHEALEGASAQVRRASAIVGHIRAFAQNRQWQPADLPVQDLLRETARFAEPEARQHGAILLVAPGCSRCRVHGDEIQLQQVLINLIRNAAEAMDERDGTRREITLAAKSDGDGLVDVSVTDTGPGIDAGQHEKLFEAFFTTKENGIGIGLALCRSIIEAHGGRLWAETSATGGAIFHIALHEVDHGERSAA